MTMYCKSLLVCLLLAIFCTSCNDPKFYCEREDSGIAYATFKVSGGWGYQISIDNVVVIEQKVIPGINFEKSFTTETEATKVAKLVTSKICNEEIPPSVSVSELKKLKITIPTQ